MENVLRSFFMGLGAYGKYQFYGSYCWRRLLWWGLNWLCVKVVKLVAVVVGLFFAGIVYLQYQQVLNIKLQAVSQNTLSTLTNATTQLPGFNGSNHIAALSNLGIPLTGSISMGIAIGFMKG